MVVTLPMGMTKTVPSRSNTVPDRFTPTMLKLPILSPLLTTRPLTNATAPGPPAIITPPQARTTLTGACFAFPRYSQGFAMTGPEPSDPTVRAEALMWPSASGQRAPSGTAPAPGVWTANGSVFLGGRRAQFERDDAARAVRRGRPRCGFSHKNDFALRGSFCDCQRAQIMLLGMRGYIGVSRVGARAVHHGKCRNADDRSPHDWRGAKDTSTSQGRPAGLLSVKRTPPLLNVRAPGSTADSSCLAPAARTAATIVANARLA